MPPEARIVIDRDPPDPEKVGKLTAAAAATEQIRARRKQIHAQARVDNVGPGIDPSTNAPPIPPPNREDIESIEFTAPNGMVLEYGPRHDISIVDRIARMYNGRDPSISEFRLTRILMGIRAINGSPPPPVTDEISRTKLANMVGDENIDILMYYDRANWPPLQESELPVLRKKLRT